MAAAASSLSGQSTDPNAQVLKRLSEDKSPDKVLIIGIASGYKADLDRFPKEYVVANYGPGTAIYGISNMASSAESVEFASFMLSICEEEAINYVSTHFTGLFNKILVDRGTMHHLVHCGAEKLTALIEALHGSLAAGGKLYIPYISSLELNEPQQVVMRGVVNQIERGAKHFSEVGPMMQNELYDRILAIAGPGDDRASRFAKIKSYCSALAISTLKVYDLPGAKKAPIVATNGNIAYSDANQHFQIMNYLHFTYPDTLFRTNKPYFSGKDHFLTYDRITNINLRFLQHRFRDSMIALYTNIDSIAKLLNTPVATLSDLYIEVAKNGSPDGQTEQTGGGCAYNSYLLAKSRYLQLKSQ
jgi:hypothetical protein